MLFIQDSMHLCECMCAKRVSVRGECVRVCPVSGPGAVGGKGLSSHAPTTGHPPVQGLQAPYRAHPSQDLPLSQVSPQRKPGASPSPRERQVSPKRERDKCEEGFRVRAPGSLFICDCLFQESYRISWGTELRNFDFALWAMPILGFYSIWVKWPLLTTHACCSQVVVSLSFLHPVPPSTDQGLFQ